MQIRHNHLRAQTAASLVFTVMALDVLSLFSDINQYRLLKGLQQGTEYNDAFLTASDTVAQYISYAGLAANVLSAITFIRWFRRAYYNVHQYAAFARYPESQALWAWWIPLLNMVRPYQIMRELFVAGSGFIAQRSGLPAPEKPPATMAWWWGLWITVNILGQIIFRAGRNLETIEGYIGITLLSMASSVIGIPLAVITVRLINMHVALEREISNHLNPPENGPGTPATDAVA